MKFLFLGVAVCESFLMYPQNRLTFSRLNYQGDEQNKEHLRGIDYKLGRYRKSMIDLIEEKKSLIKNMTGITVTITPEEYLFQMLEDHDPDTEEEEEMRSENFEVFRNTGMSFQDIGGYENVKQELLQCSDMLIRYADYAKYNVRIPKGLILEGPPGNGKTLLAKCFSGEISVSFIPVSGAQFQEKYVGVGAARVRELFELASKHVPCIIFIDELDALCRQRSMEGISNAEHDSTLNELLVNMDGFRNKPGIFIIGATNRVDLLDQAVTRPGRIDKKIYLGNPDTVTREAILKIHMKGKPMAPISMEDLLQMTQGYSGAQIENLLNEAMLYALREKRTEMTRQDLESMSTRTLTGYQAIETKVTPEQLFQVAVHEMGHAIMSILTNHRKVIKVSIHLWSPKSLGFTLFDSAENPLMNKENLMSELKVLLGGRVAEDLFFGPRITTGASQDLEQTKRLAEQMIVKWGMGKRIIYPVGSDFYRMTLDQEIDDLIRRAYQETSSSLSLYRKEIQSLSEQLVQTRELKGIILEEAMNRLI
jgi:cell division protease FtsH